MNKREESNKANDDFDLYCDGFTHIPYSARDIKARLKRAYIRLYSEQKMSAEEMRDMAQLLQWLHDQILTEDE